MQQPPGSVIQKNRRSDFMCVAALEVTLLMQHRPSVACALQHMSCYGCMQLAVAASELRCCPFPCKFMSCG
jgi:hypothetical protein